ncbi:MAG: putative porin [Sulfuricaulis sp.]
MKKNWLIGVFLLALHAPLPAALLNEPAAPLPLMEPEDPLLEPAKPAATQADEPAPAGQSDTPATPATDGEPEGTIRVPYIPETVKEQLKKELEESLRKEIVEEIVRQGRKEHWGVPDAWPEWVQRLSFAGDIRLRAQNDSYAAANGIYPDVQKTNEERSDQLLNTTEDRNRLRTRLRFGVQANLIPSELDAGFRLATGSSSDPVSTNQTLGNSSRPYSVFLDRAFLAWRSRSNVWSAWGGRMPNPWFSTDLVWDEDLAFDGVALKVNPLRDLTESSPDFDPFLTLGAFPLQEVELSQKDKWLYGAQAGFNARLGGSSKMVFAVAYYDYRNIEGELNAIGSNLLDHTAPQFLQKGNNLFNISQSGDTLLGLASDFNELNVTASFANYSFAPTHIILTLDYVKNLGFDEQEILQRTGRVPLYPFTDLNRDVEASQIKLTVGRPIVERKGEWQTSFAYKKIGGNAVLDAFTDSDFHLGGTDARGWILGGAYGLALNTWLSVRYISTDEIKGAPLGIDTLQIDLNAKF